MRQTVFLARIESLDNPFGNTVERICYQNNGQECEPQQEKRHTPSFRLAGTISNFFQPHINGKSFMLKNTVGSGKTSINCRGKINPSSGCRYD